MRGLIFLLAVFAALSPPLAARAAEPGLTVERAVILMRHGIRPPTKAKPMPDGVAAEAWPSWPVAPGYLTPHGADAVRLVAADDRAALGDIVPAGCPASDVVAASADSDQRTIATAAAWLDGFAPGCKLTASHLRQDEADPLYDPIGAGLVAFDSAAARAAILAALPGARLDTVAARERDALERLDRITGCCRLPFCPECSFVTLPNTLTLPKAGSRPKLSGGLDLGSTAAQILLLEYAEGKPMADVGWGRASAADVTAVSSLHAAEFAAVVRPHYLAARMISPLGQQMLAALTAAQGPAVTLIVGHDGQIAALGGLLDLHWQVPGLAADDPSPGGAIILERVRDASGKQFVRAIFRSQSLEQMRTLKPGADYRATLPIPGCAAPCPIAGFERLMRGRMVPVKAG